MKSRDSGGVVDSRLNVYGVQNLKVAGKAQRYMKAARKGLIFNGIDCSIAPANVGANTYNTAIAIGEKAAVIIAADLGIKGVTEA